MLEIIYGCMLDIKGAMEELDARAVSGGDAGAGVDGGDADWENGPEVFVGAVPGGQIFVGVNGEGPAAGAEFAAAVAAATAAVAAVGPEVGAAAAVAAATAAVAAAGAGAGAGPVPGAAAPAALAVALGAAKSALATIAGAPAPPAPDKDEVDPLSGVTTILKAKAAGVSRWRPLVMPAFRVFASTVGGGTSWMRLTHSLKSPGFKPSLPMKWKSGFKVFLLTLTCTATPRWRPCATPRATCGRRTTGRTPPPPR